MKKQDEIAKLLDASRKETDRFIRSINDALPERATLSQIVRALKQLPPERRTIEEALIVLAGHSHSDKLVNRPLKPDWREFEKIVEANHITRLYHFTDKANLPAIRKHGGLYSWSYCETNGIRIPRPGGNELSRQLDTRANLQDYVRLCFNTNHPMLINLQRAEQITDPVHLEIDPQVIYWASTQFSDMNATDNSAVVGEKLEHFRNINFRLAMAYNWNGEMEKKWRQAEVLVKTHVPLGLIRIPG
jgi:hypothetical protein